jgi:hypothetical protein
MWRQGERRRVRGRKAVVFAIEKHASGSHAVGADIPVAIARRPSSGSMNRWMLE